MIVTAATILRCAEPFPTEQPRLMDKLPSAAIVNLAFLPPVGQQGTTAKEGSPGTCCAWASAYGLATFTAARAGRADPSHPSGQASPARIYIKVLQKKKVAFGACSDTSFSDYLPLLRESGTQSMNEAPYIPDCTSLWLAYDSEPVKTREVFKIGQTAAADTNDLDSLKHVLASGRALCYGTRLFSDWPQYSGGAAPYWGNGDIIISKKSGGAAGHCMLIIGYSDTPGAFLIQNSEGRIWGLRDMFGWPTRRSSILRRDRRSL